MSTFPTMTPVEKITGTSYDLRVKVVTRRANPKTKSLSYRLSPTFRSIIRHEDNGFIVRYNEETKVVYLGVVPNDRAECYAGRGNSKGDEFTHSGLSVYLKASGITIPTDGHTDLTVTKIGIAPPGHEDEGVMFYSISKWNGTGLSMLDDITHEETKQEEKEIIGEGPDESESADVEKALPFGEETNDESTDEDIESVEFVDLNDSELF